MSRSIGVATQQAYRRAVAELTRWCENRKLCLSIKSLDEILEQYLTFFTSLVPFHVMDAMLCTASPSSTTCP